MMKETFQLSLDLTQFSPQIQQELLRLLAQNGGMLPFRATLVEKSVESVFVIDRKNVTIPANKSNTLVKLTDVKGSFESFFISTDNPDLLVNIQLFGLRMTVHKPPEFSANRLLRWGMGLSPGDVKQNPDGSYPDPSGKPNNVLPYLLRYRPATTVTDILGEKEAIYTMAYTPSPSHAFLEGVEITLTNPTNKDAMIYDLLGMIHLIVESQ